MLTDRNLAADDEVGYTDEEIRGLCLLVAAIVAPAKMEPGPEPAIRPTSSPELIVLTAAAMVKPFTEFVRHGTVPGVPDAG